MVCGEGKYTALLKCPDCKSLYIITVYCDNLGGEIYFYDSNKYRGDLTEEELIKEWKKTDKAEM